MTGRVTLTIKKVFYEQIQKGEKRIEYREYKSYYAKRFSSSPTQIRFHYQKKDTFIDVNIKNIEIIDNIFEEERPKFLATDKIYAIYLGELII